MVNCINQSKFILGSICVIPLNDYEKFVKTTDLKVDADDNIQFYLDGWDEEHGEVHGVIKRMRRGDYDEVSLEKYGHKVSTFLIQFGLKKTLDKFPECKRDLVKELGDEHWYKTRFIQSGLNMDWSGIEGANMEKLKKRVEQGNLIGHGSNREEKQS